MFQKGPITGTTILMGTTGTIRMAITETIRMAITETTRIMATTATVTGTIITRIPILVTATEITTPTKANQVTQTGTMATPVIR